MARGFRGMKDDLMEIINHIIGFSCCSVVFEDNFEGQLLPLPQPTVGDFSCSELIQVFSASNNEARVSVSALDDPLSVVACSGDVDEGIGHSFPLAEYAVTDEGQDPGFASAKNTLRPACEGGEKLWTGYNASLKIKLYEHDSESLASSLKEEEEEQEGTSKEICFESASDAEERYLYSKKEGEVVSIQKHMLVEDHHIIRPCLSLSEGLQLRKKINKKLDDEEIRDYHQNDGFEYVIV